MKIYSTKSFVKAAFIILFLFATTVKTFAVVSPPATCTAAIGSPANGIAHYITITWSSVSGATAYQLDYSVDGATWLVLDSGTTTTSYNHNTGSTGNLPFYYEVRTIQSGNTSAWTYATPFPIYNACNVPALPVLSGATSTTINISVPVETPDSNTSYTTYAIYCTTAGQYVQANGSLGATAVFQTRATWGTITVTGLTKSTNYCFYCEAKNNDGDVRVASTALISQPFNTNVLVENGGPSQWFIPQYGTYNYGGQELAYGCSDQSAAPGYPHWSWTDTAGCDANGAIYYQGDANWGYEGCNLTSPVMNLTGKDSIVVTLNLTNDNSYATDYIEFSMYAGSSDAGGDFVSPTDITVGDSSGTNPLYFTTARHCVPVSMTFNLTGTGTDNSYCALGISSFANELSYSSAGYYALIDDINIGQNASTACLTTLSSALGVQSFTVSDFGFKISPNPASDLLTVTGSWSEGLRTPSEKSFSQPCMLTIYNILGEIIYQPVEETADAIINIKSLSQGIYFVQITNENNRWTGRFVKE